MKGKAVGRNTAAVAGFLSASFLAALATIAAPKPVVPPPPQPPVKVRVPAAEFSWNYTKFLLTGSAIVVDPVNKETLHIGGHNGGAPSGSVGNWALAEDGTTWREMKFASAVLDPLRAKAEAARKPARLGESVARNVFYAASAPEVEAEAIKGEPAKLIAEAVKLAGEFSAALAAAKADGWERDALTHAKPLAEKAETNLKSASAGFAAGKLDAALLKNCFDAQWALDEAAGCLAASPEPRMNASAVYDAASKSIVLFGGTHLDYMTNDTWIYDCTAKTWRQVWSATAPCPRSEAKFATTQGNATLRLSGGVVPLNKIVQLQGTMPAPAGEWTFDVAAARWSGPDSGPGAAPAGSRAYRSDSVQAHNPCWYDAAARGDRKATADWIAALKPNTWTEVPIQPAPSPPRDWGTAAFDPDRDQIYRWTGGHEADPSTIMNTYHPAINRWSIPYVAEIGPKGMTFNGRPDCCNHTYLHYAYDFVSKRLICTSLGGTGVYNPDIRDFECSVDQPFNRHVYETCTAGTSRGVVLWGQGGQTWLFDYPTKAWVPFKTIGKAPAPVTDASALCYDAKRDALWLTTFAAYGKPSGNIWRCDVKTGLIEVMNPANADTIGKAMRPIRESVYLPTADLVLFNTFVDGRQTAYDPESNRWVTLNIGAINRRQGTVSDTLTWDARRGVVWNLSSYRTIYVLTLDPTRLERKGGSAPTTSPALK